MTDLTMLQRFSMARTSRHDSAQKVADEIGCSRNYLYEVLKYPEKNPGIYRKACKYIKEAGIDVPDTNLMSSN
jgi:hypothetical protein